MKAVKTKRASFRNCDVGTPLEQELRFYDFCQSFKVEDGGCKICPLNTEAAQCEFLWLQMPYVGDAIIAHKEKG